MKAQVSDTTGDDSSNAAKYIILPFFNKILILIPAFRLLKRLQKFTFALFTTSPVRLRQASVNGAQTHKGKE